MNGTGLREGLIGAEVTTPELERKYREKMQALVERRLTPVQRVTHVFSIALSFALVVFFVVQFVSLRGRETAVGLAGITVGLLFSLGWGALALSALRRGKESLRFDGVVRMQLIWTFTVALLGLMLYVGMDSPDPARGGRLILYGLAFWVAFGIPTFVAQLVRQSELRVREDLLRLELALAQVVERANGTG